MSIALAVGGAELEPPRIIGRSPAILRVVAQIQRYAQTNLPVLVVGPTGSGKELVARHLHWKSGRSGELVDVNCAALPRDMTESLLFGHRRGAFTGAVEHTDGLVAKAHRGTLFLDELGSLPVESQGKLLRVIETSEVRRVGETTKHRVDFRLISAVQEDVVECLKAGLLRSDLYHRVNGLRIALPPLRDRREDIVPLVEHFLAGQCSRLGSGAVEVLAAHDWPGNVRELRSVLERAFVLTDEGLLTAGVIAEAIDQSDARDVVRFDLGARNVSCRAAVDLVEACVRHGWDSRRVARSLSISRATLFRRLRVHGISLASLRVSGSLTPG
ncbi:MAG: sigma 54-interacting transcriptional regulator [Gemmatimonadales bacterium]